MQLFKKRNFEIGFEMNISKEKRQLVYEKFGGMCAYSGTPLEPDWQVDHIVPQRGGINNDIKNLMPVQKIINHYKRALSLEDFRGWYLAGLHKRIGKLPKNPRTDKGRKRKEYLLKVGSYFGITKDAPFSGKFYFEKSKSELFPRATKEDFEKAKEINLDLDENNKTNKRIREKYGLD